VSSSSDSLADSVNESESSVSTPLIDSSVSPSDQEDSLISSTPGMSSELIESFEFKLTEDVGSELVLFSIEAANGWTSFLSKLRRQNDQTFWSVLSL
jgi:hypothetical protein